MRVTLQTIATELGVSRMTVSNAFSRPDQLSADLRDRILATATRLGYTGPDPAARALARGAVGTVGILFTDELEVAFTDDIATRLLAAVGSELHESGRGLTLLGSKAHGDFVPARDIPLDGALVYACGAGSLAVDWLRRRGLPLVFLDQEPVQGFPCLNVDDRGGARAAAQHLVDLGHRRVAVVSMAKHPADVMADREHPPVPFTSRVRIEGWLDALQPAGVETTVIQATRSTEETGYRLALELLELPTRRRPTAVLAYSDRIALGIMQGLHEHGVSVPGEMSVVGFDDASFAEHSRPALTTVRQDVTHKGRAATALLCEAIERRGTQRTDHRVLATELVVRASSGPRPGRTRLPRA